MILFQYHSFTEDHQYLDSSLLSAKSWQILENRLSQHPDLNEDQTVKYNRKGIFGKDTEAEKLNCSVFIQRIKETEKEYLCFVVGNSASKAPKEKEFGSTARDVKATQILHYRAGKLEIAAHPPLIIKICHDEYTSNKKLKEIIESEWSWLSTLAQHTGKTSQYHYFTVAKKHYLVQPYRGQCSWEKIIQSIETQKKFCGFTNE